MKKVFFALVTLVLISCNNDKPQIEEKSEIIEEKAKELIVEIKFKTNKEDLFKLTLNNIIVDDFQSKRIVVTENVSPTSGIDTLIANFGENISNVLNINFGNKELKEIEIESINILYGENKIKVLPSELKKYFVLNKFVELDTSSNKLITRRVDNKFNPSINLKKKVLLNLQNN
ncbi:MAG: hypothetical protein ACI93N_000232 [Flavobacteriaceae bacterium]|jgi:hypothetical protein